MYILVSNEQNFHSDIKINFIKLNLRENNLFLADCGAPPQIDRAIVGDGKTTEGAVRTYTCQGQTVTEGSPKIRCEQTGVWSTSTLYCRREYLK